MTIIFGENKNDGNEKTEQKKFNPAGWIGYKMNRYYENPKELMVDGTIIMGASLVLERVGYFLNSITRATRKK